MSVINCDPNCNQLKYGKEVPKIVIDDVVDEAVDEEDNFTENILHCSSTNTSLASIPDSDAEISAENDEENLENAIFMEKHVAQLFDSSIDISTENKQKFGELCQTPLGRQLFAKYIDKQRCVSKQVDETTLCQLSQSFALVLFECYEADDFKPAKTLMNMAFTYYHVPEFEAWRFNSATEPVELDSPDMDDFTQYLSDSDNDETGVNGENKTKKIKIFGFNMMKKSNNTTNHKPKPSLWKTANIWFNKEINSYKEKLNEHFGDEEKKSLEDQNEVDDKENPTKDDDEVPEESGEEEASSPSDESSSSTSDKSKDGMKELNGSKSQTIGERIYLYSSLKHQVIWKSLRFWNAAFFDAVNAERKSHFSRLTWNSLSKEERDIANEEICNITFGQLGTFITTMKYLGLGQKTCLEFLKKQSVIGNLSKEFYQMLKVQIERPLAEN